MYLEAQERSFSATFIGEGPDTTDEFNISFNDQALALEKNLMAEGKNVRNAKKP
ncbi:MAG: hypothetical protein ABIH72_01930 [archaeon]